jgi:Domain of unknown function (DUF2828)
MFATKLNTLTSGSKKSNKASSSNAFLFGAGKKAAETLSGNGALKYSTTGNDFVDQFGKLGTFKVQRSFADISNDCEKLWSVDKTAFVKFTIYLRMISRKTDIFGLGIKTKEAQSGAELKYESIMRMLWLYKKDADIFWENIGLFISAGSCKDVIVMLRQDLVYHGWEGKTLDWAKFGELILALLNDKGTVNLMKKYLPQIRASNTCGTVEAQANNIIAKWICSLVFGSKTENQGGSYKKYRQLKNSGTAHEWQKLISQHKFDKLDFKAIHGRALNLLIKSKFLKNQNLTSVYSGWVKEQETIKYTGFVHELLCELNANREATFVDTVDKQFLEAVAKVKGSDENQTDFIVVRDTSASMGSTATGTKFTCYDIGKALALYFSEFLSGTFAGHWIEFNNCAQLHQWKGSTASAKWYNDRSGFVGSTNFQSVIDLFVDMKRKGTPESDFPKGILCISDSEFNPTQLGRTNVEVALSKLRQAGFSRDYLEVFKIVLWNLQSNHYGQGTGCKFETFGDVKNVFYMSGYSASNVKFLMNSKVETALDLFNQAMDQELLNLVKV